MIRELCAYYDRLAADESSDLPLLGYSKQKISFSIVLTPEGGLQQFADERVQDGKRQVAALLTVPGQSKPSGSGINPGFLWDNAQYMLGFKPDDPKPARTAAAFAAFRERHLALEEEINDPSFSAVCAFLKRWKPERAEKHEELAEIAVSFGVFKIVGATQYVHQRAKLRKWWDKHGAADAGDDEAVHAPSLVDGTPQPIARLHEPKIKGVIGAQTSGAAMVSFNLDAFESYGKSQSYNAPVPEAAAFKYCTALNRLTGDRTRRVVLGDTTVVYWADRPTPMESGFFGACEFVSSPEDAGTVSDVAKFLDRVRRLAPGGEIEDADVPFYVLGLAPNAARISVRFWLPTTVGFLAQRLRQHYADLEIVGAPDDAPPITLQRILDETARERDDISPLLGGAVTRAVIQGTPYPAALLRAVLRRVSVDGRTNHVRASIVKACLLRIERRAGREETIPVSLETSNPSHAYQLGRLFAVLEKTQEEAYDNGLNSTIKDRYFSAASASPVAVFSRVLRLHAHHLNKLANPKRRTNIEKLVQEICSGLPASDGFPAHLPLDDQGRFFLGYYHQRQALFTKKDTAAAGAAQEND